MAEINTTGYELGWDDTIEKDGPDFITLPEGDYDFTITNFERGRYSGGDKLPPCNKAVLTIQVQGTQGVASIRHNLYLHSTTEGLLCAFFSSIGQRKHGERIVMNWNAVLGAKGRAKIGIRKYTNKNGIEITINEIKQFYDAPAAAIPSPAASAPTVPNYEAGRF